METMIEVKDISMRFRMANDNIRSIKEFVVQMLKGKIQYRYVLYILSDLKKNCTELFVVCNGKLSPEGRETFLALTINLLVGENVGFDVWAYKAVL